VSVASNNESAAFIRRWGRLSVLNVWHQRAVSILSGLRHDIGVTGDLLPASTLFHPYCRETEMLVFPAFGIFPPHTTVSLPAAITVSP